jgi:thymidylate kinase
MLVEFLGVPGSGKSTVSHAVADILKARGVLVAEITYGLDRRHRRIARLLLKSLLSIRYILKWPYRALWYYRSIVSTKQKRVTDLAKALFNWMFIASLVDGRRASVVTFLDQGIAQALWSVGYAAQRETWTNLFSIEQGSAIAMPDLVVHVRASLESVGDRLMARAQRVSRLDSLGQDYPSLVQARTNSDAIVRILSAKGVQVIEIDNDNQEQLISSARAIADVLWGMRVSNDQTIDPNTTSNPGQPGIVTNF